jgi:pilus assembly protein TadC
MVTGAFVHGLRTAVAVGVVAVWIVGAIVTERRERASRRRARTLFGVGAGRSRIAGFRTHRGRILGWVPVVGAAVGLAVLVGGIHGCLAGAIAGYVIRRRRLLPRRGQDPADVVERQLPLAADLMAACLASGAGPHEAADAVGRSLSGPFGGELTRVAAELRLGGDPARCWGRFASYDLGRCMERACTTGVPPVEEVSRLAAAYRAERGRNALARARRAGVLATAPLGLCFLPAFLLVGVAPVVMGLAGTILAGGPN